MTNADTSSRNPLVGVLMGSISDWDTMKHCCNRLAQLGIPYERQVLSGHRTPTQVVDYAHSAENRGLKIIIAAAGGAAHLAGMLAGNTHLPVLGVPMKGWATEGMDALLATVQMPAGIPVMTLAIGKAGAINAAMSAAAILSLSDSRIRTALLSFRAAQTQDVLNVQFPD